jgi:hypothetical protein
MAGIQRLLILATAALFTVAPAWSQETEDPAGPKKKKSGANSPEMENVRKAIEALSPEQRKRFQENFAKWANLSPEEKRALRDRDETRRKKMGQEIDRAMEEAGVVGKGGRRGQFARRYTEERRKLEEKIRQESEVKRTAGIQEIVARLKEEFAKGEIPPPSEAPVKTETTAP